MESKNQLKEIDQFVGNVIKFGSSLSVTIPINNVRFSGLKEGDLIKVYFKIVKKD